MSAASAQRAASPVLDAALSYAALGWNVFPAPPGEKKGHKKGEAYGGRRWGNTTDPSEVAADWARWPNANVGIACGPESGLFVVEADTLEGHAVDGIGALDALIAEHGPVPDTVEQVSPSGSRHLFFAWPDGQDISSRNSPFVPGVDVKARGGMVLAAPSIKPGVPVPYRWVRAPGSVPLAQCPNWLLKLCQKPTKPIRQERPMHAVDTDTDAEVLGWLYSRPNNLSRDDWVRLGFALKAHFGDRAKDAWLTFSARYSGPTIAGEADRQWESSQPTGEVSLATAIHLLGGFQRSESFQRPETRFAPKPEANDDGHEDHGDTFDPDTGEVHGNLPEPVDLWAHYSAPILPVGLLPNLIERFARKHGEVMGADPAGLAMSALTVCAGATTSFRWRTATTTAPLTTSLAMSRGRTWSRSSWSTMSRPCPASP